MSASEHTHRSPPESLQEALTEIEVLKRKLAREQNARAEAEQASEKAMRVAVEDPLTKLANRAMVNEHLRLEIEIAKRRKSKFLVLYLDLDQFKTINDTYGHETGDALLCHAAEALKQAMRPEDLVGRLGGDEFVVITSGVTEDRADWFIQRLHQTLMESPLEFEGLKLPLRASIGAAAIDGSSNADDALHRADTAMYHAKKSLFTNCRVFDHKLAAADRVRRQVLRRLPQAVENDELRVHYQPIVSLQSGYVDNVEALVRWQLDDELLPPEKFIPIAEESGYIAKIGQFILEQSLRDIAAWRKKAGPRQAFLPSVSVNISSKQLLEPGFSYYMHKLFEKHEMEPSVINLEITEVSLLGKDDITLNNLVELSRAGHQLALDDFGTGHSSLTMLRSHPFSLVKIDRSFLDETTTTEKDKKIIRALNDVAHTLGARTVAEGVETQEQLQTAVSCGCDFIQGFLVSQALPADQVEALFDTHFETSPDPRKLAASSSGSNVVQLPTSKR